MKLPSKIRVTVKILLALFVANLVPSLLRADVPTRSMDENVIFDERGDAKLEISFGFGAAQWQEWRESIGDHPDILLRNLRYTLASGVIEDFKLEKDDVNRKAICRLKVRALARYRSNGEFVIEIPKDWKMVTGSGRDWVFTKSSLSGDAILNETQHGNLPEKAQNVHFSEGRDFNELSYSLNLNPPRPKAKLAIGMVLLVIGVGLVLTPADRAKGLLVHVHPNARGQGPSEPPPLALPGPGDKKT
jgi:hypothetical protein